MMNNYIPGGGGGTSDIYWWGVCPGTPKEGGLRCGHSPKMGVLGAGTAPKRGGGVLGAYLYIIFTFT